MSEDVRAANASTASAGTAARIHQALASVTRVRLFRLLDDGPTDIARLVEVTGLHYNTVRNHLEVLVGAGLVVRDIPPAGRPGRPSVQYRLADPPADAAEVRAKADRALLETLTAVVDEHVVDSGEATAVAAESIGRAQVAGGQPPATVEEALVRVTVLLAELGFEPELEHDESQRARVLLRRCPFDDLARRYGDVVCAAHLGIIRGALAELGARVRVELQPFVEPELCIAAVSPAAPPSPLPLRR